eukprot:757462-Hanusia_phi.AAC.1
MQEMLQRMREMWEEEMKKTKALSYQLFARQEQPVHDSLPVSSEVVQVISGRLWFLDHSDVWFNDAFIIRNGILRGVDEYDELPDFVKKALELDAKGGICQIKPSVYIDLDNVKACLDGSFSGYFYGYGEREHVPGINVVEHDGTVHRLAVDTEEEQGQWIASITRTIEASNSSVSSDNSADEHVTNTITHPPVCLTVSLLLDDVHVSL